MIEVKASDEIGYKTRLVLRILQGATLALIVNALVLFVSAGRLDLPMFWLYIGVRFFLVLVFSLPTALRDPALFAERSQAKKREDGNDSKTWQIANRSLPFLIMIVAGLDVGRLHGWDTVPLALQLSGVLGATLGTAIVTWATRTNTFFSSVVRVQRDRGQRVISSGPYRFVRHPGYLGMLLRFISFGLILGSWAAVAVAFLFLLVYVIRIRKEELVLLEQLEGYRDYASRVRYRIVPAVW